MASSETREGSTLVPQVALAQQGGDSTMERITNAREKCSVESRTGLTT